MGTKYQGTPKETAALDAFIALKRSSNSLTSLMSQQLAEYRLTPGQFGVLEALFHLGPLTQREIGDKLLSTKGNITMLIDNLEKSSLVKRVRDLNDRRSITVQLTPKGKKFIGSIVPGHMRKIIEIMSVLSLEEMKELKRLCKKIGLPIKEK